MSGKIRKINPQCFNRRLLFNFCLEEILGNRLQRHVHEFLRASHKASWNLYISQTKNMSELQRGKVSDFKSLM